MYVQQLIENGYTHLFREGYPKTFCEMTVPPAVLKHADTIHITDKVNRLTHIKENNIHLLNLCNACYMCARLISALEEQDSPISEVNALLDNYGVYIS